MTINALPTNITPHTPHFTWHEALWLPQLSTHSQPNIEEQTNIIYLALRMEKVRALFNAPIRVHCWHRPFGYNQSVGGAPKSAHITGRAVDFHIEGLAGTTGCAEARAIILPHLETLGLRMENQQGPWIHLDTKPVPPHGKRFFRP